MLFFKSGGMVLFYKTPEQFYKNVKKQQSILNLTT